VRKEAETSRNNLETAATESSRDARGDTYSIRTGRDISTPRKSTRYVMARIQTAVHSKRNDLEDLRVYGLRWRDKWGDGNLWALATWAAELLGGRDNPSAIAHSRIGPK
jgi:hypothetical protein